MGGRGVKPSALLFQSLREPGAAADLPAEDWNVVIRVALAERLLGTLAAQIGSNPVPPRARAILDEALASAAINHAQMRFEVERMAAALSPLEIPVLLMKGAAYLMAELPPLPGRDIGDLDIMVPEAALGEAEAALKAHGWRSVKARGTYDDAYYRDWMHELPPLAHERRGHVIDLHHNILPRTARLSPKSHRMIEEARPLTGCVHVMSPEEMLLHSATHLAYDGDFLGGARNLWDIDRLTRHFAAETGFWERLGEAALAHDLSAPLARALRLSRALYGTPSPAELRGRSDSIDRLALRKLYGRDRYGQLRVPATDFLLFLRGHWLRMPPLMLARHLTTKWRARRREARE